MTDDLTPARGCCDGLLFGALMWLGAVILWSLS